MISETDLYVYRARAVRVIDGDTIRMEIDLGLSIRAEHSIRVRGINTPELFSGDDRARGRQATDDTEAWIASSNMGARWPFLIRTFKDTQTFNRYVADVYDAHTGESLADYLRTKGWT